MQWIACRGVILGYDTSIPALPRASPAFKPQNYTTRGQVARSVVLAFALPINTTGGPRLVDVPQGSNFYDYIETAYNKRLVNGYSDNTFHPGNNVSSNRSPRSRCSAAINTEPVHWTLLNPADNTFEEAVQGSTFSSRRARRGPWRSRGHPWGSAAGPCGPQNKPYFLPENNATRRKSAR